MPIQTKASEIDCLAKAIYFESRGEPIEGQVAVGLVISNRVENNNFPNSYCSVISQGSKSKCAFSYYCDNIKDVIRNKKVFDICRKIAIMIINNKIYDFTEGSLYYHNVKINPNWDLQRTIRIHNHIFYREHE